MSRTILAVPAVVFEVIERLFKREGYVSDHPADKGGYTKWGITLPTLSRWLERPATKKDLDEMDLDTARQIYYQLYILKFKIDKLANVNERIAEFMFDFRVNSGAAIFEFQRFLGVKVDGDIGPKTLLALRQRIQDTGANQVLSELCDHRIRFCIQLCESDHTQIVFLEGWFNRIQKFRPAHPVP